MVRRIVRLYPLYAVGITLGLIKLVGQQTGQNGGSTDSAFIVKSLFAALFMLPNWGVAALVGPRWSLTYELIANAAYAAIVHLLSDRVLIALVTVSGAALILAARHAGTLDAGWSFADAPLALARVTFSFFAGVLIYRIHSGQLGRGLVFVGCASAVMLAGLSVKLSPSNEIASELAIIFVVFPLLTFLAAIPDITGWFTQICGFLGVTSYAVYVIHEPAAGLFASAIQRIFGSETPYAPVAGYVFLGLLLVACWLLDRFYDQPVRQALARRFLKRPVPQGGTAQLT